MRALVCHAPLDLRLDSFAAEALGPQQLRVRVAFGGICGSDLHYFQHGGFGTVRIKEPMVLGHEVSGVVERVGSEVAGFHVGQRIAISPSRPCGLCRFCQLGQHNHCSDMRFYGSAMRFPHVQGAFRETLVIDASQAHAVADELPLSEAALAEPLSVGLHAISRAGSVFGKRVLVTGCGPIGALLIAALRRAGAAQIVAADLADVPLACAKKMGADETINLATQADGLAPYAREKGQFDVMFEASGSDKALRAGLDVVAPRGVIVAIGLGGDILLPLNQIVGKELELRGTFRFHTEFAVAVRFLNQRLIDGGPVISHTLDFEHANEAFELAGDKRQAMKVQIAFGA
ncbi:L-idonate 5-dehydrogenase [Polaromonas jejuensis]|uniref:L-idonate 5-dehydrogenase n=1 Tax=Polaromonas jejuensis TaxID=457502 RepID=A0ABW0Q6R7_9BURK|nr:L-idonate 5-dehydrogenase [Polaromonas jejuensis]